MQKCRNMEAEDVEEEIPDFTSTISKCWWLFLSCTVKGCRDIVRVGKKVTVKISGKHRWLDHDDTYCANETPSRQLLEKRVEDVAHGIVQGVH